MIGRKELFQVKRTVKPKSVTPIHINKTGRICFNQEAAEHMGDPKFMKVEVDGGVIRLEPTNEEIDGALLVSYPKAGYPYISEGQALPLLRPLGFDGGRPYDIEPKCYGTGAFEFRLDN
jgi:hypothetical protein